MRRRRELGLLLRRPPRRQRPRDAGAPAPRVSRRGALPFHLEPLDVLLDEWATNGGRALRCAAGAARRPSRVRANQSRRRSARARSRPAGTSGPHLPAGADLGTQRHRSVQPGRPHLGARPRLRPDGDRPGSGLELDCEPVDVVARSVVDLSASRETVFHLGHVRPRHWRECVLWMRMYGYDVRLVSYHAWLRRLERETVPGADGSPRIRFVRCGRSFSTGRPARVD